MARRAPGDLADHACLTFAFADGERRWRFTQGERVEQIRVTGPLRANQAEALKEAALAGLAGDAAIMAGGRGDRARRTAPHPHGMAGRIEAPGGAPRRRAASMPSICPTGAGSPKVRAFVDFLAARFPRPIGIARSNLCAIRKDHHDNELIIIKPIGRSCTHQPGRRQQPVPTESPS
jgi:hypothetical protein